MALVVKAVQEAPGATLIQPELACVWEQKLRCAFLNPEVVEPLIHLIRHSIKPERVDQFLDEKREYLDGRSPMDLIKEGKLDSVITYIRILRGEWA